MASAAAVKALPVDPVGEDRVGIDRLVGRPSAAHAPAARERRLAVLDDRDRHAGDAICAAELLDALARSRPAAAATSAVARHECDDEECSDRKREIHEDMASASSLGAAERGGVAAGARGRS